MTRRMNRLCTWATACLLGVAPLALRAHVPDAAAPGSAIDWIYDDVDAAFARAHTERKPVFLYWGATWCPPCNQVKATLFKQREFIERSRQFVPVYLDGDRPAAQSLADRFRVVGYPTMILFSADGVEITRLPGEIDPQQYLQLLSLGLGTGRSARATLHAALGPRAAALPEQEWMLLASYSWDTDEGQLVARDRVASTLLALSRACPPAYRTSADRLTLRAIVAAAAERMPADTDRVPAAARVQVILDDPARARAVFDVLVGWAPQIAGSLTEPHSPARRDLIAHFDGRLAAFAGDNSLAAADRLDALTTRAQLQKLQDPNADLPAPLIAAIRAAAAQADRDTTDRFERQAVISSAAQALSAAGLDHDSDALLTAELARSAAPYYLMLELAANARKRGDGAAALDWYRKAYAGAQGPATRLQWGSRYAIAVTEIVPAQPERVDEALAQVLGDISPAPETFHGRNRIALERLGKALSVWNTDRAHDATLRRAAEQMDALCAKLPAQAPERSVCGKLLAAP